MAQRYNLAELHGGPLDGQVGQVPLQADGRPELVVGIPVPVLDEATERFWWDTGNYFFLPAANPPTTAASTGTTPTPGPCLATPPLPRSTRPAWSKVRECHGPAQTTKRSIGIGGVGANSQLPS